MTKEEFKRFKELKAKSRASKLTDDEANEFKTLLAKDQNFKKNRRDSKHEDHLGDPGNDFSWWNKFSQLTNNAANLKSNWIAGTPIAGTDLPFTPTGVLRVKLASVYGSDRLATDPLNVWARDLYLKFFQKWRGVSGYTASDLGMTIIAAIEAVKTVAKYERIYGIINRYSRLNVNMPIAEQAALGLTAADSDYLRSHLSDFRYDLNVLIQKAQRLCVPKDMSIIADSLSLLGYEYMDHESVKSQIIVFDTVSFGLYQDTLMQSGGMVQFITIDSTNPLFDFNADNMCAVLDRQLQNLLGSDSVQKIFADMVVWFGEEAMLHMLPITEEYIVAPVKSDSILHKLHNIEGQNLQLASLVEGALSAADQATLQGLTDKQTIYQCDDRIVSAVSYCMAGTQVYFTFDGVNSLYGCGTPDPVFTNSPHVLDTYRAEPTQEVIVEGCLFKYHAQHVVNPGGIAAAYLIKSVGFWIVTDFELISIWNGAASVVSLYQYSQVSSQAQSRAGQLAVIDWAPLTFYISGSLTVEIYGDIDNPIPLYANDIGRILTTVIYSGLHTGMVAKS